jgi:hypothetical protein
MCSRLVDKKHTQKIVYNPISKVDIEVDTDIPKNDYAGLLTMLTRGTDEVN